MRPTPSRRRTSLSASAGQDAPAGRAPRQRSERDSHVIHPEALAALRRALRQASAAEQQRFLDWVLTPGR